ncbi:hypothetical protein IEQ34_006227 [Dendrobium chrysotoxum]|uniref:Uncharacterized protein n=1 Tax=Dendrobium chrysotoxum TaxID=161865 RepID=A0AAV7GX85_DENCH|nr:hypothetical protein IEQ34_006227 [Dendrobium chrysotoxum]
MILGRIFSIRGNQQNWEMIQLILTWKQSQRIKRLPLNLMNSNENFGKLPSFKLDVPDLNFSSPSKKKEKTTEKSSKELVKGKKEPKGDKFSFNFDFNSFDLDSKSLEDKRPINFSNKNVPELPSKHEMNQVSGDNNSTSINIARSSNFAYLSCLNTT